MADFDAILAAVAARGSDATSIRDAAHEAHHAIETGLRKPWTRDNIHAALVRKAGRGRMSLSMLVSFEVEARAVEMLVCQRFGVEYDVEAWANTMWWETAKSIGINLPTGSWCADAIRKRAEWPSSAGAVEAVLALGQPSKAKRKNSPAPGDERGGV